MAEEKCTDRPAMFHINVPDQYGNVPLHTAVIRDDVALLEELLNESHIDVNYRNQKGENPLILSLRMFRSESFVKKLVAAGCEINATNKYGQTSLHVALLCSSIDVIHDLIEHGADVNMQDEECRTPLHYAVDNDNLEAVCMLLTYGADVSMLCKDNMTAFTLALYRNRTDIAEVLFNYYDEFLDADLDGYNALHLAAWHKSSLAFDLVHAGIDVNSITFDGSTALALSLYYDSADLFKLIWSKLDQKTLLARRESFLLNFIETLSFSASEWLECMYTILSSPIAFDLMEHCKSYFAYEAFEYGLFSKLLKTFYWFDVEVDDRVSIILMCLGLGYVVNTSDINFASVLYGFNEELHIFLYAGGYLAHSLDLDGAFNLFPQPAFIFSVNDVKRDLIIELFKKQIESTYYPFELIAIQNNVVNALSFFSLSFAEKQQLLDYCGLYLEEHDLIASKVWTVPELPSLLELSRNQSRVFIQRSFNIRHPYQFHDVVKSLNLPSYLKNIIMFKTPVY
ncbi:hypothetical protein PPYR_14970 [Photinus pyralis]|uniref:Uncharacterized protein n=1 Tax=Photinus pyralis TaxID=7054 RepID=A0A1Y1L3M2_PHOPY|nr:serine/threonine-protein phosphatase 6 regulatory ankyrin repeat subunit C-like [Photinus pyralis]KAB0790883.1 hypothetical protein PPYR_14970 [Photinus pyralis]